MVEGLGMSDEPENTHRKQGTQLWKPGQSGNPAGRPKGSRSKLGEQFIQAMYADFTENGADVIKQVRIEKPDQYLKVVASILPKELHIKDASLGDMTDSELMGILETIRAIAPANGAGEGGIGTGKASRKARVREEPSGFH